MISEKIHPKHQKFVDSYPGLAEMDTPWLIVRAPSEPAFFASRNSYSTISKEEFDAIYFNNINNKYLIEELNKL